MQAVSIRENLATVPGIEPGFTYALNLALQKLHDWVKENELTIDTSKTTYDYTLKYTISKFNLTIGNNTPSTRVQIPLKSFLPPPVLPKLT
jgi:hypothetical protein